MYKVCPGSPGQSCRKGKNISGAPCHRMCVRITYAKHDKGIVTMNRNQRCVHDSNIPCCDALKVLMYCDYVHCAATHGVSTVFVTGGNTIGSCNVPADWCIHYQKYHNKTVCRFNNQLQCDKNAQLMEFARQNPSSVIDADKWDKCMCNPVLCMRYLAAEKQNNGR